MTIIETTDLTLSQKEAILMLWNKEYPEKLNYLQLIDFENYLDGLAGRRHYLLITDNNIIKGWAFTFIRDNEKWFAIILDQSIHGLGYGTKMLEAIKAKETVLNGWVMDHNNAIKPDGTEYKSPSGFYLKNAFTTLPGTRLETEKLSAVKIVWKR